MPPNVNKYKLHAHCPKTKCFQQWLMFNSAPPPANPFLSTLLPVCSVIKCVLSELCSSRSVLMISPQVLDYYSAQGLVDVTPISLPGYQPNLPILQHMYLKSKLNNKRQNELIPYNDCLYRNMYR